MSPTSVYLAEEVLALPSEQRQMLAKLLMESVQDDGRSDDEIRKVLTLRLEDLQSGRDPGMSFDEVFDRRS